MAKKDNSVIMIDILEQLNNCRDKDEKIGGYRFRPMPVD